MYLSNYFIVMFCKYFVINFLIGLAKATFNNNNKKKLNLLKISSHQPQYFVPKT